GPPGPAPEQGRGRRREALAGDQVTELRRRVNDGGRPKASPLARRIARERGIDLTNVAGTGPEGRVVAEDVERAAATGAPMPAAPAAEALPVTGEVQVEQLSSMRKTIARRLTEAWQAPAFQLGV